MSGPTAKEELHLATESISVAVEIIRGELPTIEAFLKDEAGLCTASERRAVWTLLSPLFRAARDLVATYDDQAKRGRAALDDIAEKVAQS